MSVQHVQRFASLVSDNSVDAAMKAQKDIAAKIIETKGAETGWAGLDLFLLRVCSTFSKRCRCTHEMLVQTKKICDTLGKYNSGVEADDATHGVVNLVLASEVYKILGMEMCFHVITEGGVAKVILNNKETTQLEMNQDFRCEVSVTSQQGLVLRYLAGDVSFYDAGERSAHATPNKIKKCFNLESLNGAQQEFAKQLLSLPASKIKAFSDAWYQSLKTFDEANKQIKAIFDELSVNRESTIDSDFFYKIYATSQQDKFTRSQIGEVVKVVLNGVEHLTREVTSDKIMSELNGRLINTDEEIRKGVEEEREFVKKQAGILKTKVYSLVHELFSSTSEESCDELQGSESVEKEIDYLPRNLKRRVRHCIKKCENCEDNPEINNLEKTIGQVSHLLGSVRNSFLRGLDEEQQKNKDAQGKLQQDVNKVSGKIASLQEKLLAISNDINEQSIRINEAKQQIERDEYNIRVHRLNCEKLNKEIQTNNDKIQELRDEHDKLANQEDELNNGLNNISAQKETLGTKWYHAFKDKVTQMDSIRAESEDIKKSMDYVQDATSKAALSYTDKINSVLQFDNSVLHLYAEAATSQSQLKSYEQELLFAYKDRYGDAAPSSLDRLLTFQNQDELTPADIARNEYGDKLRAITQLNIENIHRNLSSLVQARNKIIDAQNASIKIKKNRLPHTNNEMELKWLLDGTTGDGGLTKYVALNQEAISVSRELALDVGRKKSLIRQLLSSALSFKSVLKDSYSAFNQIDQIVGDFQRNAKAAMDAYSDMSLYEEGELDSIYNALRTPESGTSSERGAIDEINSRLTRLIEDVLPKFISGYEYIDNTNSVNNITYTFDKKDGSSLGGGDVDIKLTEQDEADLRWLMERIATDFIATVENHSLKNKEYLDKLRSLYDTWNNELNQLNQSVLASLVELEHLEKEQKDALKENKAQQEANLKMQGELTSEIASLEQNLAFVQNRINENTENIQAQKTLISDAEKHTRSLRRREEDAEAKVSEARSSAEHLKKNLEALQVDEKQYITKRGKLSGWNAKGDISENLNDITKQVSARKDRRQVLYDTQNFLTKAKGCVDDGILNNWVSKGNISQKENEGSDYRGIFLSDRIPYDASGEELAELWSSRSYWQGNQNHSVRKVVDQGTSGSSGVLSNATDMDGTKKAIDGVQNEVFQQLFDMGDDNIPLLADVRTSVTNFCKERQKEFNYKSLQEYTAAKINALKISEDQLRQTNKTVEAGIRNVVNDLKIDIYKAQMVLGIYMSRVISDDRVLGLIKQNKGFNASAITAELSGRTLESLYNGGGVIDPGLEHLNKAVDKYANMQNQTSLKSWIKEHLLNQSDESLMTPIYEYLVGQLNIQTSFAAMEVASGKLSRLQRGFVSPSLDSLLRFGMPNTSKGMDFLFGVTDVAGGKRVPGQGVEILDDDYQKLVEERRQWETNNSKFQNDVSRICAKVKLNISGLNSGAAVA
ncbi:hypothetical protein [Citrobacter sp. wls826]|uniref:hypothetical protein n=1 Tax=Citrobacter sp. wls826 TaxID=2576415 RepID=UPI0010C96FB6|nr:hypothetical protein [Citrobacter sp. wls826]TKU26099.1 hypothetical protein FDW87_00080 [Citrobacter sp. wls826]TKV30124.1 hypothetical protein FDX20_27300 [Citrobacter sp. TBCS-11]